MRARCAPSVLGSMINNKVEHCPTQDTEYEQSFFFFLSHLQPLRPRYAIELRVLGLEQVSGTGISRNDAHRLLDWE